MRREKVRGLRVLATISYGLLLVLAMGCVKQAVPSTATSKPLRIGVLAALSGPLAPEGDFETKGAEVGKELINQAGGILGRKIELVIEDDRTDPATAAERAKKLIQQDKVDLLMGTISSATTLAVIPLVEEAKIPYLYIVEGEDKTCTRDGKTSPYVFGNGETPEQKFIRFAPYMLRNYGKKFYFVGSDYVFPHFVNATGIKAIKENGGQIIGEDYAPLGTNDFSSIITKIERAAPDVLFISVVGTDGIAFVKQLAQFGIPKKVKITGFPTFEPPLFGGIKDVAQDVVLPARYSDVIDNPINKAFVEAYRKRWNFTDPIAGTAAEGGYGSLLIFKAAIEKANSFAWPDILKAMEGLKVHTTQGEITLNAQNHIAELRIFLLQIKGNRYQIVEDFGTIAHPNHSGCSRLPS